MKRLICVVLVAFLMCVLVGCDKTPSKPSSNLSGSPAEILNKLVDDTTTAVKASGKDMYMSTTTDITSKTSQNEIGLSAADFEKYVTAASSSMAAIGSQAHEIVLIQAKDADSAAAVKKIVAGKDGYNPQKWICVWPQKVVVIDSGNYVLIVASRADIVEAALNTFKDMAGSVGEADQIYEHME